MVLKEQQDDVRVLRLANPPGNVLNKRLLQTLSGEIEQAAGDRSVRALVLTSAYPRYFSTGIDLEEVCSQDEGSRGEHFLLLLEVYRKLRAFPKPSVAAVRGSALLGGWILAMACDFRLLSDDGRVSLAEVRAGLSPSSILLRRLSEISASPTLVKEMALKGRTVRAQEALAGGIVDVVLPSDEIEQEALKEARSLAKLAPGAYASIKRSLSRLSASEEQALWKESRDEFSSLFGGAEAQEGIAAMREKRRARFTGQ